MRVIILCTFITTSDPFYIATLSFAVVVDVEEVEDTDSDSFDLQAFLAESDSIAQNVVSQLNDASASYSNTENWLDLLQSTKLFG